MGKRIIKKRFNLVPNSVALGVAVFGARASLYSQQFLIPKSCEPQDGSASIIYYLLLALIPLDAELI